MAKKRAPLGKGLDALLGNSHLPDASQDDTSDTSKKPKKTVDGQLLEINIIDISSLPDQPRKFFDEDSLQQLADSIRAQGVLQPIIVKPTDDGLYQLIAGERRWRASQKAGLKKIPAVIRDVDATNTQVIALLENLQRQDLNPIEISEALNKLSKECQLVHNDIAKALAISRPAVSNLMRLADLPPSIKTMLIEGSLDMGHARAILSVTEQERLSLARHTVEQKLTVRQTEALAKNWPQHKSATIESTLDRDIQHFAQRCAELLSAKVTIHHKKNGAGTLSLGYSSLEQLHSLTGKLSPALAQEWSEKAQETEEPTNEKPA